MSEEMRWVKCPHCDETLEVWVKTETEFGLGKINQGSPFKEEGDE